MILIEVDDDEAAEKLVAKFSSLRGARIAGMFQVPKARCRCDNFELRFGRRVPAEKRSLRGRLFGWWVHDKCGRPTHGSQLTKNLLKPEQVTHSVQAPETYVPQLTLWDRGHIPVFK